jgi:hypothetical protein
MATIKKMKKAQDGDNLRKGQYKRVGRIAEKNPDRAYRVAERMNERASRVDRGKEIANPRPASRNPYMQYLMEGDKPARKFAELRKSDIMDDKIYKKGENPYKTDKNGNVIKQRSGGKTKMKSGGSLSGLKASNKRVGPVDPKGAYTKVQKKTLAGAKGKATLTKDKQLGATKMKMGGKSKKH